MKTVYIGIDLAWGEKNASGFAVLAGDNLEIIDCKMLLSIEEIVEEISHYLECKIYLGVDAPLLVPNTQGNREIEKNFNKEFSVYKIAMLPINRTLLTKFSSTIRSEELFKRLSTLDFKRDYTHTRVIFEVYPHSSIAVCFNDNKILPYKRKKGRDTAFIKTHLSIYQNYLLHVIKEHPFLREDISLLKGKKLKEYEDKLDAIVCAYTLYYCRKHRCKLYKLGEVETFLTPISL